MISLSDITSILKRWDEWKRIEAIPGRVDELEKRVAELEAKLRRAPGEACPRCGALDFRVEKAEPARMFGAMGSRVHHLKCGSCGFTDSKTITPK